MNCFRDYVGYSATYVSTNAFRHDNYWISLFFYQRLPIFTHFQLISRMCELTCIFPLVLRLNDKNDKNGKKTGFDLL